VTNIKTLVVASLFAAITTLGAYVSLPIPVIPGVPFTLQVLIVILTGIILEANQAALALGIYILLGLIGVPVFHSGTAGPGVLFGPTGGYLFGFLLAVYLIGLLARKFRRPAGVFAVAVIGVLVLHLFGLIQFIVVTNVAPFKAFLSVTLPYLVADLIKAAVAVPLGLKIRRILEEAGFLN
jgi:biotin transport system substrate-specific component